MRPHFWLPEKTASGEAPRCDNCERFGKKAFYKNGTCGRSGWICGIWEEAKEVQMSLFDMKGKQDGEERG